MKRPAPDRKRDRRAPLVRAPLVRTLALLCALSACAPEPPPRPLRTFAVVPVEQSHMVAFEAGSVALDGEAQRQLHAFARSHDVATAGKVVLEGGEPEGAARQAAVAAALRALGVPAERITAAEGALEPGLVRVTLHGDAIVSLDCAEDGAAAGGTLPWGCVNELNLLHMVEDPEDLLRGRSLGPGSAGRAVRAMQSYQRRFDPQDEGAGAP